MPIFEDYLIAKLITKIDFRKVVAFSAFTTREHGGWKKNFLFFLRLQHGEKKKLVAFSAFTTWEHGEWEKNCLFFLHLQQGERKKKDKNLKNIKIKKNYMN